LVGQKLVPIKDRYVICWGWHEESGGLLFDERGEQPGVCAVCKVDGDNLISVNPKNWAAGEIGNRTRERKRLNRIL